MKPEKYWELNQEELGRATKALDEPMAIEQSRPLRPEERNRWRELSRDRGPIQASPGFKRISVQIEQGLLDRINVLAHKRRISGSRLLAEVLEEAVARHE